LPKQLLQASAKIWESAGFKVALFDDVRQMVWEKLIMNVALARPSVAAGLQRRPARRGRRHQRLDPAAWQAARRADAGQRYGGRYHQGARAGVHFAGVMAVTTASTS
jgi:hypothetical protein